MTVISKVKQTIATLSGTKATLRMYSIQEQDEEAKMVYEEALDITDKIIIDLESRVRAIQFEEPQYKEN
jgi:hypothetical protein